MVLLILHLSNEEEGFFFPLALLGAVHGLTFIDYFVMLNCVGRYCNMELKQQACNFIEGLQECAVTVISE